MVAALDELFKISVATQDFEQALINKMKSVYKSFDSDKFWAAAMVNDRLLKSLQVSHFYNIINLIFSSII